MLIVLEILAIVFTFLYLWFIAKKKPLGWIMGIVASVFSVIFFYLKGYYGSCLLNIIYIFQGVYGYIYWQIKQNDKTNYHFKIWKHIIFISIAALLYFSFIKLVKLFSIDDIKNIDIALASLCILATYIETKKDTSCWWYWIILNLAYCFYYFNENLYLYALQMLVLSIFSAWALRQWLIPKASKA